MGESRTLDALVVGAGFSGLYQLVKLRQGGFTCAAVEAGSGVGGTWFWNRYPGARCDIPSVEYSYSFDQELEQEWTWSERYSAQPEILSYLEHVADRYDLERDIAFNTRVTAARWDEERGRWLVQTDTGQAYDVQFLILATGALSTPKPLDLPGLENFAGPVLYTATWDDSVNLAGKAVCHFGTGSSGIQAVGEMATYAGQLTVFQRTPNYAVPAGNRPLQADEVAAVKARYPVLREIARNSPLGWFEGGQPGSAKADPPDVREARLEAAWNAGTTGLLTAYEDLLFDLEANAHAAQFARDKVAQLVKDPDKVRKLQPDYPVGSRRTCTETNFYDAMNRDSVALVDVREEPVVEVTADAVVTTKGRYPADAITIATGFDACTGAVKAIDLVGKGGQHIAEEWADGPRAYLGLMVAGFPNMFTITGPGSPSVLSNVVVSIEQHGEWVTRCMEDMRSGGQRVIDADPAAEQAWMAHVDELAHQTVFPAAPSWYMGRTRDGRQVFMPYVGGVGAYRAKCDAVRDAGYEGFVLSA